MIYYSSTNKPFYYLAATIIALLSLALLSSQNFELHKECSKLKMEKKGKCPIEDILDEVYSNYQNVSKWVAI
jgi:hypothetical protein